jgi:pimeloyl-ACP methyl ester carboxylesterase
MCEAADAVLDYALNSLKYKYHATVVMGRSLGSIPAVHLASKTDNAGLQGLVLVSGLASGARCIFSPAYTPSVMLTSLDSAFGANIQRIPGVQCMILLVHGDHDTEVSLSNSQVLKERCNGWCHPELIVIRGGSHNNIWNMYARQVLKPLNLFLANSKENARLHSCDEASKTPYTTGSEFELFEI